MKSKTATWKQIEKYLEKIPNGKQAKVLRKIGYKNITADFIRYQGGVPVMLFAQWCRTNKMTFDAFTLYFEV